MVNNVSVASDVVTIDNIQHHIQWGEKREALNRLAYQR